jgi:hypothetical protein
MPWQWRLLRDWSSRSARGVHNGKVMLRPFRDTHLAEEYRCCASTRSADGDLGQARASESGFKLDETRPKTNAQEVVMSKWRSLAALLVAGFFISFGATYSRDRADAQSDQALRIDILVKLEKANVVFDRATWCSTVICPFSSETWIYSPVTSVHGTSKVKLLPSFTETPPISC